MQMDKRAQVERLETQKRREASEKLSANAPDGAFADDPRAEGYDKYGTTRHKSNSNLMTTPFDLGQYPPNE